MGFNRFQKRAVSQALSSEANQRRQPICWAAANWDSCPVNAHLASRVCLAVGISLFYCVCFTGGDALIAVASVKKCRREEDLAVDEAFFPAGMRRGR